MNSGLFQTTIISILYTLLIFLIAGYAHLRKESGRSIVDNPYIYTLSIAVYCTSWTFYGNVGKAATTGIDYIIIYLGPSLIAFSWIFLLNRIIRISRENNITSIADFISLRYGKSPLLGALVTLISLLAIMPYIALQIKSVSTSFYLMSDFGGNHLTPSPGTELGSFSSGLLLALILSVFSIIFGARRLVSSERHEGLMAAVAFESLLKILCLLGIGVFVTYHLHDGFSDIFSRFRETDRAGFDRLLTFDTSHASSIIPPFSMMFMSMGAIMLLPRQFHVMVIENCNERHINTAMWLFPLYLFLANLFVMPIALSGILSSGSTNNADFFVLSIPLLTGHRTVAMLAYLGGLSAAAGMVMVESVTISTMLLNHIFMPVIVRFTPRPWFPGLLLQLKRFGIFLVVLLGFYYYRIAGSSFMLVNLGLISFAAVSQFIPAMLGGLYWRRGNRTGAISGILLGFVTWFYTLFLPSFSVFDGLRRAVLDHGPFGISLLKPTALFGLSGMDMWSHSLFWSMFFNVGSYIICSLILRQNEQERDQVRKFIDVFDTDRHRHVHAETKRLSKPVTINQFVALMSKFIGETEAKQAIASYIGDRRMDVDGHISEFELPNLKRFTEKTLAGSVGVAAAGAIVDSFLSDMGSRMELVYDIFSTVKTSLDQSREALSVRIKASEIINRTLDLQTIMDDLLRLLLKEFGLDITLILLKGSDGRFLRKSCHTTNPQTGADRLSWLEESEPYYGLVALRRRAHIINDTLLANQVFSLDRTVASGIVSCAYIPIQREGEEPLGIIAVFSRSIPGLFTEEFISLLESLAAQLAQTVAITREIEAKEQERAQKEEALLQNARITRDMEIAQQIQLSLLPEKAPDLFGVDIGGRCISATHVGGDYYDFFLRDDHTVDLLIADVSGHSVGAALIMAEVRTLLRPQVNTVQSACSILKLLNSQLYEDLTRAELFITMFYAKYNSATGRLSFANAGHNRPLICREGEASCIELDAEGLIIGVKPTVIFEERSIELLKGDVVLFYTDGLNEATNSQGESFGVERVCNQLKTVRHLPSRDILDSFYAAVTNFTGLKTFQDDISLMILKIL